MSSHAGHKYFCRVTGNHAGNKKINCYRCPERDKIETNSTEYVTHVYPFPTARPQELATIGVNVTGMADLHCEGDRKCTPLLYTINRLARLVYSRDWACPCPHLMPR